MALYWGVGGVPYRLCVCIGSPLWYFLLFFVPASWMVFPFLLGWGRCCLVGVCERGWASNVIRVLLGESL